jgi:hypothetical protein
MVDQNQKTSERVLSVQNLSRLSGDPTEMSTTRKVASHVSLGGETEWVSVPEGSVILGGLSNRKQDSDTAMPTSITLVVPPIGRHPDRSAAKISLEGGRDLLGQFPDKPSAADFIRALDVINKIEEYAPAIALQLIWPIWRRHDHVPLMGGCVKLCARNLDWSWSPDAFDIARRFVESLELFPELALLSDPAELGQRILSRAVGGATLHYCALAHLVAPGSSEISERFVLELARAGELEAVLRLLPATEQGKDVFFSKLLDVIPRDANETTVIDLYAQIADRLSNRPTLASLRLGERMGSILQSNAAHRIEPLQMAHTVARVRKLLKNGDRVSIERGRSFSAPRNQGFGAALLEQTEPLMARYLHNLVRGNTNNRSYSKHTGEGRISWVRWQIECGILAFIPASKFLSHYAKREGTWLYAKRHVAGEVFQFGPYIDLPAGTYRVVFLGNATNAILELAVVSLNNSKKIQSVIRTSRTDEPSSEILGTVDFCLLKAEPSVEFLIYPMTHSGELWSSGVKLQCTELF